MRFEKLEEVELSVDVDRQTAIDNDAEDDKSNGSLDKSLILSLPAKKEETSFWQKTLKTIHYLKNCLIIYGVGILLITLNTQYFEINQVCPYKSDFDCLYRYLICEGDCSDLTKPMVEHEFDFYITHLRKDGFFFNTRLANIVSRLVIIAFIFSLVLTMGLFKKGARILVLIVAANIYYLRTYRDGDQHGDYTYILGNWLTIIVGGLGLLFGLVIILGKINSRGKGYAWAVLMTVTAAIMFALYGIANRFTGTCDNWDKGLYGERIDNTVNCQFNKPGFCMYEFIGDLYDYNKWLQVTCADRKPHWDLMDEKYPNVSRVGFPLMRGMTKSERQFNNVPVYVDSHIKEVTDANEKDFEVVLHRTFDDKTNTYRDPVWIDINIQFNQELVEQRSNLVSESLADNVLVLYIDTMSRAAAFRSLPETMKVFEQMTPKMHQFFKYHSIGPYTLANMYPMYYGVPRPVSVMYSAHEKKSFIHQYKDKGFITGRALSHCALSALNTNFDHMYYNQIDEEPFDHMGNGWACDINFRPKILNEGTTGPMSMLQRCVYGKEISEYVIDYGKKFWNTYKDQKKFLWLDFLDFHDHTASHGKYLDQYLSKFLSEMDLKDTMLMLVSDHGQHVYKNAALWKFKSGEIERSAPSLFIKLPEKLEPVYGEGLEGNKQQIVQAFDLNKLWNAIPNPILAKDTILQKLPPKSKGCDFSFRDQQCQCVIPK